MSKKCCLLSAADKQQEHSSPDAFQHRAANTRPVRRDEYRTDGGTITHFPAQKAKFGRKSSWLCLGLCPTSCRALTGAALLGSPQEQMFPMQCKGRAAPCRTLRKSSISAHPNAVDPLLPGEDSQHHETHRCPQIHNTQMFPAAHRCPKLQIGGDPEQRKVRMGSTSSVAVKERTGFALPMASHDVLKTSISLHPLPTLMPLAQGCHC